MLIKDSFASISRRAGKSGFTLVEIMVAIFILSVTLLGLAGVTVMVTKGNSFSKTMTTATTIAKDQMEALRRTGFASLASGGPVTRETIYSLSWTVTPTTVSGSVVMETLTVTVTWPWQGRNHTVSLNSIAAK